VCPLTERQEFVNSSLNLFATLFAEMIVMSRRRLSLIRLLLWMSLSLSLFLWLEVHPFVDDITRWSTMQERHILTTCQDIQEEKVQRVNDDRQIEINMKLKSRKNASSFGWQWCFSLWWWRLRRWSDSKRRLSLRWICLTVNLSEIEKQSSSSLLHFPDSFTLNSFSV
jgi:hypothetical protein